MFPQLTVCSPFLCHYSPICRSQSSSSLGQPGEQLLLLQFEHILPVVGQTVWYIWVQHILPVVGQTVWYIWVQHILIWWDRQYDTYEYSTSCIWWDRQYDTYGYSTSCLWWDRQYDIWVQHILPVVGQAVWYIWVQYILPVVGQTIWCIYDLVPKGVHTWGYALQLKIKHCWKMFWFEILCCVLAWINEYIVHIISATRLWLISRYSHHTLKKRPKKIFVTLLTNKSQAHGETITDFYVENIVLYR